MKEELESGVKYPEHEKLKLVKDESQKIGEFLEWLETKNWHLAYYDHRAELTPLSTPIQELLALYFDIDLKKIEEEKRMMLAELRHPTTDEP